MDSILDVISQQLRTLPTSPGLGQQLVLTSKWNMYRLVSGAYILLALYEKKTISPSRRLRDIKQSGIEKFIANLTVVFQKRFEPSQKKPRGSSITTKEETELEHI